MFGHGDRDTLTTRQTKAGDQIGVRKAKAPPFAFRSPNPSIGNAIDMRHK